MGWDFSALLRYAGPTPAVAQAISRLERQAEYLPLQSVIEYGQKPDYAFARPGSRSKAPAWRSYADWERILACRPAILLTKLVPHTIIGTLSSCRRSIARRPDGWCRS